MGHHQTCRESGGVLHVADGALHQRAHHPRRERRIETLSIGGTSAGLAVLGEFGFSAKHDTVTSAEALANPFDEKVDIHRGLLHIPTLECLITDSHFAKRDRMGRLLVFLGRIRAESGCESVRGIGVDERAAVTLDEKGRAQVMGEGAAYLVRLADKPALAKGTPANIPAMPVIRIPSGSGFDWGRWGAPQYHLTVAGGVVKSSASGIYGGQ